MEKVVKYTIEENVLILISLLKRYGIKTVIASPGSTNMTFVASVQHDDFFQVYSCVDERSAAYMACGMAEDGEPVVITCTGATASRNYMPGLTEAFYRKLPVLAVTCHTGRYNLGKLMAQQIDRTITPNDIVVKSVELPYIESHDDWIYCETKANDALQSLLYQQGSPVHINLISKQMGNYSVNELPSVRKIDKITLYDKFPELPYGKIVIFVGSHKPFSDNQTLALDSFCAKHDAVVFVDKTSGYQGKYAISASHVLGARKMTGQVTSFDLCIHIGEISGDYYSLSIQPKQVWRVSHDGVLKDKFDTLSCVFEMREEDFFDHYNNISNCENTLFKEWQELVNDAYNKIPDLPFSNVWVAKELHDSLPQKSELHLGILNTLRSWNFFSLPIGIRTYCNVGGFGIDGTMSTLIGASLRKPDRICYGILGDLSFFYDLNAIGNRHILENLRIIIINNGKGNEFRLSTSPGAQFGDDTDSYIAAGGHFGNKSNLLLKNFSEALGFEYISASNKEEFNGIKDIIVDESKRKKPLLVELFIEAEDDVLAIDKMLCIYPKPEVPLKKRVKKVVKRALGAKIVNVIRKIK